MPDASATLAVALLGELTAGVDFTVPAVDLTDPDYSLPAGGTLVDPTHLTNADLTTGAVGGTGTFDVLMEGAKAHLTEEYNKGRITGEQYAKLHGELLAAAMQNSVAFLLGRDTAYWQAVKAQQDALTAQVGLVTARVQLQIAKVQLQSLNYEMQTNKANFALTEMKLATESVGYDSAKYSLDNILPAQKTLVTEQSETARAQTMNTRSDGVTTVVGLIGKQKDLYSQQITSYKRDAETKIAKLFTDSWITQKTIDEGLLAPSGFTNTSLDEVLSTLKANVQFDGSGHP